MDETTNTTPPENTVLEGQVIETKDPNFAVRLANKYPRAARVFAIVGAAGTALGGALLVQTVRSNQDHLELAGEHAKGAVQELSATVTPSGDVEA